MRGCLALIFGIDRDVWRFGEGWHTWGLEKGSEGDCREGLGAEPCDYLLMTSEWLDGVARGESDARFAALGTR